MAWNHNSHYHPILLGPVPPGARRVLDIGCGEGLLTRRVAAVVPEAVGIDSDSRSIDRARAHSSPPGVSYLVGDFLTYSFEAESFDAVLSVAVLHHVDAEAGLARMVQLLRPGGVLGIVGLARSTILDLPYTLLGALASRVHRGSRPIYEPISPMRWPPPHTFRQMKRIVQKRLPGAQYRRHLLWRYSVIWRKPHGTGLA
jgi:2-polyprenyl-3-methyl-5-hydroxy-6-metoxy-1,4-benzoquinol methylase